MQRWMMKHHSKAGDYSNLDFEAIHKEIMAYKDVERAKSDGQAEEEGEGEGPKVAQFAPLDEPLANPSIDQAPDPNVVDPAI